MAIQTIQIAAAAGQTLTLTVFEMQSDVVVDGPTAATEVSAGLYEAAFIDITAGGYRVEAREPGNSPVAAAHILINTPTGLYNGSPVTQITYRVVDADAIPVANAQLELQMRTPPPGVGQLWNAYPRMVASDSNGRIIRWLPVGGRFAIIDRRPGTCGPEPIWCEFAIPEGAGIPYQIL